MSKKYYVSCMGDKLMVCRTRAELEKRLTHYLQNEWDTSRGEMLEELDVIYGEEIDLQTEIKIVTSNT